jgi:hypothetical protein
MSKANYSLAFNEINKADSVDNYINARYAPTGNNQVGLPFPAYKEYGGRFTQWQPSALEISTLKKQMNLPTDNNTFRQGFIQNAIGTGDESLKNWTFATQTLANPSFATMFCTSNDDCAPFGQNYSCNSNYEPWPDSYGNQSGSVCSYTAYPEVDSGTYVRKDQSQGGIGKKCNTDNDCGSGYECNQSTDFVGRGIQQTGYCSQTYNCADGKKRYIGYPYNSGIPVPPPKDQNNNGLGYQTEKECKNNAMAQQNCIKMGNTWFATYPGYCPVQPTLRVGSPQGALMVTGQGESAAGFQIPAYGPIKASSMGGSAVARAFTSFGAKASTGMNEPLQYEMALNPRPANMY